MKNILAENMLRFGVKNLNESKFKRRFLKEQAANGLSVQEIEKMVTNDRNNKSTLDTAKNTGQCVFIKSPKVESKTVNMPPLQAQFWNNMVSLKLGLMPETPLATVNAGVTQIIKDIQQQNLTNLQIEIIGTATTATAGTQPDGLLLAKSPKMQLDHPGGKPYGGGQANNEYLAKQRAESIKTLFAKLLPTAKYTTTSNVIEGGATADALRYIQVKVTGDYKTNDKTTISNLFMDWTVSYQEVSGTTTGQRSNSVGGGASAAYIATLLIKYGQKNVPVFNGQVYYESAEKSSNSNENTISDPKRAAKKSYPYLIKSAGTTDNPNFSTFLASCGYFDTIKAYDIAGASDLQKRQNSMYRIDSDIFQKMAAKKTGNLQDFIALAGGSDTQIMDAQHALYAYVYDIIAKPPTLTQLK